MEKQTFNYTIGTEVIECHSNWYGKTAKIVSETKTTWVLDNGTKICKEPRYRYSDVLHVYGKKNDFYSDCYIAYELVKDNIVLQKLEQIKNILSGSNFDVSKLDSEMIENFKKMIDSAEI